MKVKRTIYLVTDYGGEYEDAYEYPYMAFDSEQAANECAEKRSNRLKSDTSERPYYYYDYDSSDISAITLIADEQTCENVYDESECGACDNGFKCSACGCTVEDEEHYHVSGVWNWCPQCGKRVWLKK